MLTGLLGLCFSIPVTAQEQEQTEGQTNPTKSICATETNKWDVWFDGIYVRR